MSKGTPLLELRKPSNRSGCDRMSGAAHELRDYDESLGSGSDGVSGVARDESQFRVFARTQHTDIGGYDDTARPDHVVESPSTAENINIISVAQSVNVPKERIAMPRDYGVARITRKRGSGQVSRPE